MITFWILWQGNNLYVMNPLTNSFKSTLAKWKTLISYTVFTMFCKVALQLVGCVFLEWFYDSTGIHESMRCTVRQLFSIVCVNSVVQARKLIGADPLFPKETDLDRMCTVIPQEAQIGFDAIALGFLVFQLRVFHSWFFQHCMVEYRSEIILANRGAVLKNQLIEKEMKEQNEQQKAKFNEILNHGEDDDEDEEQFYYHYATTPPGSMSSVRSFELPVTSFVASKIMSHTHLDHVIPALLFCALLNAKIIQLFEWYDCL
ncbi:hypothetical protein OSTOST_17878 [Ostertagia ostertagi]